MCWKLLESVDRNRITDDTGSYLRLLPAVIMDEVVRADLLRHVVITCPLFRLQDLIKPGINRHIKV